MRVARGIGWSARLLTLFVLGAILTGCGTFSNPDISFGSRIGFRPDDPQFKFKLNPPPDSCEEQLNTYIRYAVELKEAYRTRATQNRSWLYVAAIVGLGVAAASGGLGIAGAAAGTIALLAVSGGFTAGAFATIDNAELANVYTVAANDINNAVAHVEARMTRCYSAEDCSGQLAYLREAVTTARNALETARTSSAAGALARATAQKKLLDDEITKVQAQVAAQAKAKDATEKRDAATEAQVVANKAKEKETAAHKEAQAAPNDTAKQQAAKDAKAEADGAQKEAKDKDTKAAAAEAKAAAADGVARQAAMAPVTPECLADSPAIVVQAAITDISPTAVTPANRTIKLTVTPIRLGSVPANDLKVSIGGQEVPVTAVTNASGDTWEVAFIAPAPSPTPPGLSPGASYDVSLLVGRNKQHVGNNSGKKLQY